MALDLGSATSVVSGSIVVIVADWDSVDTVAVIRLQRDISMLAAIIIDMEIRIKAVPFTRDRVVFILSTR